MNSYQQWKQNGDNQMSFDMGPNHSLAIGPFKLKLLTDGETVQSAIPQVGHLHRGFEKIAERLTWISFVPYLDRIDYLAPIHSAHAYCLAVEKLANLTISDRAKVIRIVVGELSRVSSHLLSIGLLAKRVGAQTAYMFALRDREKINNLFEMLTGARLTFSYIRIGGVAQDVTDGFIEKTYEFLDYFIPKLKEFENLILNNLIFKKRLDGVGQITVDAALKAGVTGPNLRAAGCGFDIRKTKSNTGYQQFSALLESGSLTLTGDALSRINLRFFEMIQSMEIIRQALNQLPEGSFLLQLPRVFKVPAGNAYECVESPRGVFGVYIESKGEKYPYRVKFRTPSFAVLSLFPSLLEGTRLSDVPSLISSLDLIVSEIDR